MGEKSFLTNEQTELWHVKLRPKKCLLQPGEIGRDRSRANCVVDNIWSYKVVPWPGILQDLSPREAILHLDTLIMILGEISNQSRAMCQPAPNQSQAKRQSVGHVLIDSLFSAKYAAASHWHEDSNFAAYKRGLLEE